MFTTSSKHTSVRGKQHQRGYVHMTHMYTYIPGCTVYTLMYACARAHPHACTHGHAHLHMYTLTYMQAHANIRVHSVHPRVHACTHMYTWAHTHTRTPLHTHTHKPTHTPSQQLCMDPSVSLSELCVGWCWGLVSRDSKGLHSMHGDLTVLCSFHLPMIHGHSSSQWILVRHQPVACVHPRFLPCWEITC